jgi:hypothetical protein
MKLLRDLTIKEMDIQTIGECKCGKCYGFKMIYIQGRYKGVLYCNSCEAGEIFLLLQKNNTVIKNTRKQILIRVLCVWEERTHRRLF